jgi:hypothetical protein
VPNTAGRGADSLVAAGAVGAGTGAAGAGVGTGGATGADRVGAAIGADTCGAGVAAWAAAGGAVGLDDGAGLGAEFALFMLATVFATASAAAATVLATVPITPALAAAIPAPRPDCPVSAGRASADGVAARVGAPTGLTPPASGGDMTKVALQRAQRARTPAAGMRDGSTRNVV